MRLFNFFFNRSKQEQDKPIRDKIKNRKHFEKLLSEEKEVIKQRNEIISKGNQNDSNSYIETSAKVFLHLKATIDNQ